MVGATVRALALADLVLTFPNKDLKEVPHFCGRPTTYEFFLRIPTGRLLCSWTAFAGLVALFGQLHLGTAPADVKDLQIITSSCAGRNSSLGCRQPLQVHCRHPPQRSRNEVATKSQHLSSATPATRRKKKRLGIPAAKEKFRSALITWPLQSFAWFVQLP